MVVLPRASVAELVQVGTIGWVIMQDIPVNLGGYTLMVTEEPSIKMREGDDGELVQVINRAGELQFVVSLFAKAPSQPGRRSKGEEITVNLPVDPGKDFKAGTYVELIKAVINTYEIPDRDNPRKIASAGIWFKAEGLKPAKRGLSSAA